MKVNDLPSDSVLELSLVDCNHHNQKSRTHPRIGEKQPNRGAGGGTRTRNKNNERDLSVIGYARIRLFDEATGKLVQGQKRLPLQLSSSSSSSPSSSSRTSELFNAGGETNTNISSSPQEESTTEKELIVFTEELERFEEMPVSYTHLRAHET